MPKPLRIFISSPGDVVPERRRAQLVIEKLAKTYARYFAIKPILWEVEPMLASGHFQDQITPPSETDIVIFIVWSRLGTPLPEKTETREYHGIDGRAPVTGTEWEFEDALAGQKKRGAPDLLAYRKDADPTVSLKDIAALAIAKEQWDKLNDFWNRWFVDRGQFRAAFSTFVDLDIFETKLESHLRKLIEQRIEVLRTTDQTAQIPIWLAGSPFRGLDSYRFEHAPIFFGRSAMTKAAVEQLTENAELGRAFLLILGASGSGKSSLAQAGAIPVLIGRGIVPGVGLWRRAVMRPSGHAEGPFVALAQALTARNAVPELLSSKQDINALAHHLKAAANDPSFSIIGALNGIEEAARARGEILKIETARLALVVDQLEELLTASDIGSDDCKAFIRCLDGLARSGRVYVLATMRSDFWHRTAETPQLVDMAAGKGRLDLLPPQQDEVMEMIRQPAQAADIEFETDPVRGIKLDAMLVSEAANEPGVLPLLSFLLDELYKKDVEETGRSTLTYASMGELNGLKGAIAMRAEGVFEKLSADAQLALPKMLRALVTVSSSGAEPTARAAPMARFSPNSPEWKIVNALLSPQVRLLVADGDGEGARIRLAHEALITNWERASHQIAEDMLDIQLRARLESAAEVWSRAITRDRGSLLLRPGKPLSEAEDLLRRRREDLNPTVTRFIEASGIAYRTARHRRIGFGIAATAAAAAIAVFASYQLRELLDYREQRRIEASRTDISGTFIAFSTEKGRTALDTLGEKSVNSPFLEALLHFINDATLDINTLFTRVTERVITSTRHIHQQVPELSTTLNGRVYLRDPPKDRKTFILSVGVAEYRHIPRLKTPIKDAEAFARAFDGLGYDVRLVRDPDHAQLVAVIDSFISQIVASTSPTSDNLNSTLAIANSHRGINVERIEKNDASPQGQRGLAPNSQKPSANKLAILYLAGNGIRIDGIDYFLPIDADFVKFDKMRPADRQLLISVDDIVTKLAAVAAVQIVIVDACRDDPSKGYSRDQR